MTAKKLRIRSIRIDEDSDAAIQRAANTAGMSYGAFVRRQALGATSPAPPPLQPASSGVGSSSAPAPEQPPLAKVVRIPRAHLDAVGPDPFRGGRSSQPR